MAYGNIYTGLYSPDMHESGGRPNMSHTSCDSYALPVKNLKTKEIHAFSASYQAPIVDQACQAPGIKNWLPQHCWLHALWLRTPRFVTNAQATKVSKTSTIPRRLFRLQPQKLAVADCMGQVLSMKVGKLAYVGKVVGSTVMPEGSSVSAFYTEQGC